MVKLPVLILCGLFAITTAGPASDITGLVITGCSCSSHVNNGNVVCRYRQMGYALNGRIVERWTGGTVSCSSTAITDWGNIIIGWNHECNTQSTTGTFEVEYSSGRSICGKDFDKIAVNSCRPGTACSQLGSG